MSVMGANNGRDSIKTSIASHPQRKHAVMAVGQRRE